MPVGEVVTRTRGAHAWVLFAGVAPLFTVGAMVAVTEFEAQASDPPRIISCSAVFWSLVSGSRPCAPAAGDRALATVMVLAGTVLFLWWARRVASHGVAGVIGCWGVVVGLVLVLSPFTTAGDGYEVDGTSWRQPVSCPPPVVSVLASPDDGGLHVCAETPSQGRLALGLAGCAAGTVVLRRRRYGRTDR